VRAAAPGCSGGRREGSDVGKEALDRGWSDRRSDGERRRVLGPLLSFDTKTQLLGAWDTANNRIGLFQYGDFTAHLPGIITHAITYIPPDPCRGFIEAYNAEIRQIDKHGLSPERSAALLVRITLLSDARCGATIATDSAGNLLSFQPHS
jgi:hypothetical protein